MRLHRFIVEADLSKKEVEITDPKITKQIKAVLRLGPGDRVMLSDGKGAEAEAVLATVSDKIVLGTIEKVEKKEDGGGKVNLYLSILKKENFELAVQKSVEAGVASITPIICQRTIKTGLNMERIEKIIREASEQSGRSVVPRLAATTSFDDAIVDGKKANVKMLFHPRSKFYEPIKEHDTVSIFIGPEGGFTDKEIDLAKDNEYGIFSLGPLILRAETAAMIVVYRAANLI